MTSFVHVEFATSHPGVERFESVLAVAKAAVKNFDSGRGLATLAAGSHGVGPAGGGESSD